jgi:hypothetical protein
MTTSEKVEKTITPENLEMGHKHNKPLKNYNHKYNPSAITFFGNV